MRHMIARRVARQDLPQKRVHGGGRIQSRLSPHITQFATDLPDPLWGQNFRDFALDLFQHGSDKWRHPWPPGKMGLKATSFSQEAGIVKRPIPRQPLNHNSATAFSFRLPLVPFSCVPFYPPKTPTNWCPTMASELKSEMWGSKLAGGKPSSIPPWQ